MSMNDFKIIEHLLSVNNGVGNKSGNYLPSESGTFGVTFKVCRLSDNAVMAMKAVPIKKHFDESTERLQSAEQEIDVLIKAESRHPFLLQPIQIFEEYDHLHVLMDLADGESLSAIIRQRLFGEMFEEEKIVLWLGQLALALKYLHTSRPKILHCDVKPTNIFISNDHSMAKLSIFGCVPWANRLRDLTLGYAHYAYYAPEYFDSKNLLTETFDVWSLGVIAYQLCTRKFPFENIRDLKGSFFMKKNAPPIPHPYGGGLRDLVNSMLTRSPTKRPNIVKVLSPQFIKSRLAKNPKDLNLSKVRKADGIDSFEKERLCAFLIENSVSLMELAQMEDEDIENVFKKADINLLLDVRMILVQMRNEEDEKPTVNNLVEAIKDSDIPALKKLITPDSLTMASFEDDDSTLLHLAVKYKRPNIIGHLLQEGASLDATNSKMETPFMLAARLGYVEVGRMLLEASNKTILETQINDGTQRTALHIAAAHNHRNFAKMLLDYYDANPKATCQIGEKKGLTAIHVAALLCKPKSLEFLANWNDGALLEAKDGDGETPLHVAVRRENFEGLKTLVECGANVEAYCRVTGRNALHTAAADNDPEAARILVEECKANIKARTLALKEGEEAFSSLQIAVIAGHAEMVTMLIRLKADIMVKDNNGNSTLHLAAKHRQLEILPILCQHGPPSAVEVRNNQGRTTLHFVAARHGDAETTRVLISPSCQADLTARTFKSDHEAATPLHLACIYRNYECAKVLLGNRGKDFNVLNGNGDNPLHYFTINGDLDAAKFLLDSGADIDALCSKGRTALHKAAMTDQIQIAEILVERGANTEATSSAKGDNNYTPLIMAAQYGSLRVFRFLYRRHPRPQEQAPAIWQVVTKGGFTEIAECLLETAGPSLIDSRNPPLGRTALHNAAVYNKWKAAKILTGCNAKLELETYPEDFCRTALHLATAAGSLEVAEMLLKAGANIAARDINYNEPLHIAALSGRFLLAKLFVKSGAYVKSKGFADKIPLHNACIWTGEPDDDGDDENNPTFLAMVEMLSTETKPMEMTLAEVKQCAYTAPLWENSYSDKTKIVKLLYENSPDTAMTPDNRGDLPIHYAAATGHLEAVRYFVTEERRLVEAVGFNGRKPLHCAVLGLQTDVTKFLLLETDANVNAKSGRGNDAEQTALHLLLLEREPSKKSIEIAQLLLENGASVDLGDVKRPLNRTTTAFIRNSNWCDVIKVLVNGRGVDDLDTEGRLDLPPLMRVVTFKENDADNGLVDFLLESRSSRRKGGNTAVVGMKSNYNKNRDELLLDNGLANVTVTSGNVKIFEYLNRRQNDLLKTTGSNNVTL